MAPLLVELLYNALWNNGMTRDMEREPDMENVDFIDEHPDLQKKVWLRRLHAQRQVGRLSIAEGPAQIIPFPTQKGDNPDGAA